MAPGPRRRLISCAMAEAEGGAAIIRCRAPSEELPSAAWAASDRAWTGEAIERSPAGPPPSSTAAVPFPPHSSTTAVPPGRLRAAEDNQARIHPREETYRHL